MKKSVFVVCLVGLIHLFGMETSSDFSHPFNHSSGKELTEFTLMGLRCSGTNFIERLMVKNFPSVFFRTAGKTMPHKHHWPFLNESIMDYPFLKHDRCLYILIVRNPYEWLQSLFLEKGLMPHQNRVSFYKFISSEWKYALNNRIVSENQKVFRNVLDSRNIEMENCIKIGGVVENFVFVPYEKLRDNPKGFIDFLAEYFHLEKKTKFVPIRTCKDGKTPYKKKKYFRIPSKDMQFINENLAWDVENSLGYFPKTSG